MHFIVSPINILIDAVKGIILVANLHSNNKINTIQKILKEDVITITNPRCKPATFWLSMYHLKPQAMPRKTLSEVFTVIKK
jgi:hypothetical protein